MSLRDFQFFLQQNILRPGFSKKDLLSKLYIALKECSETRHWLELLYESKYIDDVLFKNLYNDCQEIMRILSSSTKTLAKELE